MSDSEKLEIWTIDFPEILNSDGTFRGFDVIIANPPYGVDFSDSERKHFARDNECLDSRKNSASIFIERGSRLATKEGIISFIIPKSLSYVDGWQPTRNFILNMNKLLKS